MELTALDRAMLDGRHGEAARFAMSIVVRMAEAVGAEALLSIEQAHIDACALRSRSSLDFIRHLAEHGGQVRVPTTLSMVSLDLEHWASLGVPPAFAELSSAIASAYRKLGCIPSWTCAPYQGVLTPRFGQQVAWGESNAVVYANSVLGARTNRYADFLDICAAVTGRVPHTGLHRSENRHATIHLHVEKTDPDAWRSPAAWAALGAVAGRIAGEAVPVIDGVPGVRPSNDMLKAFGAAAASFGSVGLVHLVGITPEAPDLAAAGGGRTPKERVEISRDQLTQAWDGMSNAAEGTAVDAIVLGCPHFSYAEFEALAAEIARRGPTKAHGSVRVFLFAAAPMIELARRGDLIAPLEQFGVTLVRDTCPFHCPIVPSDAAVIVTNSGKCAYYAPGELDVRVGYGTLEMCVDAAISGRLRRERSPW